MSADDLYPREVIPTPTRPQTVVYVAALGEGQTARYRALALERLGHRVILIDTDSYVGPVPQPWSWLRYRLQTGVGVKQLNEGVISVSDRFRPEIAWFDKPIWIRPQTVRHLRGAGVTTIHFEQDNPFTPFESCWRLLREAFAEYDVHVVPRYCDLREYRSRGARRVCKVQFSYEPTVHFPPPSGWSDRDRTRTVSFIGSPRPARAEILIQLWRDHGIPLVIDGPRWRRYLPSDVASQILVGNGSFGASYRRNIWGSRVNLSFITHENHDEVAHRTFEIAACQSFQLAERSEGHARSFREDVEVPLFSSAAECAAKIRLFLGSADARLRMASAARARAVASGYDNDSQVSVVMSAASVPALDSTRAAT